MIKFSQVFISSFDSVLVFFIFKLVDQLLFFTKIYRLKEKTNKVQVVSFVFFYIFYQLFTTFLELKKKNNMNQSFALIIISFVIFMFSNCCHAHNFSVANNKMVEPKRSAILTSLQQKFGTFFQSTLIIEIFSIFTFFQVVTKLQKHFTRKTNAYGVIKCVLDVFQRLFVKNSTEHSTCGFECW